MARSLIGLHPSSDHVIPITPAILDSLLIANGGYDPKNNITLSKIINMLTSFGDVSYAGLTQINSDPNPEVVFNQLDTELTKQIYQLGHRVVLKFSETTIPARKKQPTAHYVWVIGKEGDDWKVADGGWASAPQNSIDSLRGHIAGFATISDKGQSVVHNFAPELIYAYQNGQYTVPNQPGQTVHRARIRNSDRSTSRSVNLSANLNGSIQLVLTDPEGRRLRHDANTSQDLNEIPNGAHWTEEPIDDDDDDDFSDDTAVTTTQLGITDATVGTYSLAATGTAEGAAIVSLEIIGPGGGSKNVNLNLNTSTGNTVTQQFTVPEPETADLSLVQSVSATEPSVGQTMAYNIVIHNAGPGTATSSRFVDFLSDDVEFVSAEADSMDFVNAGNIISGMLPDIPSGGSFVLDIVVKPKLPGTIINTASINGFEYDPNRADNLTVIETKATTTFDAWLNSHFTAEEVADPTISGPNADPDGDGIANLLEYALGLDPKVNNSLGLPVLSTVQDVNENLFLALSYTFPSGVTDVTYAVEVSEDLLNWETVNNAVGQVNNADETVTITVSDSVPISAARRFMRLRISRP